LRVTIKEGGTEYFVVAFDRRIRTKEKKGCSRRHVVKGGFSGLSLKLGRREGRGRGGVVENRQYGPYGMKRRKAKTGCKGEKKMQRREVVGGRE